MFGRTLCNRNENHRDSANNEVRRCMVRHGSARCFALLPGARRQTVCDRLRTQYQVRRHLRRNPRLRRKWREHRCSYRHSRRPSVWCLKDQDLVGACFLPGQSFLMKGMNLVCLSLLVTSMRRRIRSNYSFLCARS